MTEAEPDRIKELHGASEDQTDAQERQAYRPGVSFCIQDSCRPDKELHCKNGGNTAVLDLGDREM